MAAPVKPRAWVIGAGMAGLSAAVELTEAGFTVDVAEAAAQAGGRCRSYHDPQLGRVIDNGNHLVLSGNRAVAKYLATIGASDRLSGPDHADFAFVEIAASAPANNNCHPRESGDPSPRRAPRARGGGRRWVPAFAGMTGVVEWAFRPNDGPLPWWIFARDRRVPGTSAADYLRLARLMRGTASEAVADRITPRGPIWDRLLEPVLLAALNTAPAEGSAKLTANVLRESLARGGRAMRPRIAEPTLAAAFVDPALAWLSRHGATVTLGKRLRALRFDGERIAALDFGDGEVAIASGEPVILAVPPWVASTLVPGLTVPDKFRAIVNAHFAFAAPVGTPAMIGVIGGEAQWIFSFPDRLSVTVSAADAMIDTDRAELAATFWAEIAAIHGLPPELPPWQIVKEKRATFAATPAQDAKRPLAETRWANLFLAGDWTQTGLPATIEGAVRSGATAARLASASRLG